MRSLAEGFPASLIRELTASLSAEATAESAIPSYTHWNPAIRWLMFRRLELIRQMAWTELAGAAEHGSVAALDFGCGIGMMIPALAGRVATLYVCDEQLAPARATARRFDAANVVCLAPEEIGSRIAASSLDIVIAADVFEHVEDLMTVVETLRGRLRPGGVLIVSGPTENWAYRCGRRIVRFSGAYHVRNVFAVESVVRAARFTREQLRTIPLFIALPLFRITLWRRDD